MRFLVFILSQLLLLSISTNANATIYFVSFKYKATDGYTLAKPSDYLSSKAIERRHRQGIAIDSTDLPVSSKYLKLLSGHVDSVMFTSKWLNGALVKATTSQANALLLLSFVKNVSTVSADFQEVPISQKMDDPADIGDPGQATHEVYGEAYSQVRMVRGDFLHSKGFKGKGLTIAVIDAGFDNYNELAAFNNLRGGVVDTYDFTKRSAALRASDVHGTKVLSLLAASIPARFCGSAIEANYALFVTESSQYEQIIEEYYWGLAAERADSLGCDVVASSLGYSKFDYSFMNHTVADLCMDVAPSSRAASLAAKKGMLVVVSAGNEGNRQWEYVTFPADSPDVVAVGAVTLAGKLGVFSSLGPANSVKPQLVGMGVSATMLDVNGNVVKGNGTSYSAPQIAGFAACLWQAFPLTSSEKLKKVIYSTASNSSTPNSQVGYGVPNFELAYTTLKAEQPPVQEAAHVTPNPFRDIIKINVDGSFTGACTYQLFGLEGTLEKVGTTWITLGEGKLEGLEEVRSGIKILKLIFGNQTTTVKVIKL